MKRCLCVGGVADGDWVIPSDKDPIHIAERLPEIPICLDHQQATSVEIRSSLYKKQYWHADNGNDYTLLVEINMTASTVFERLMEFYKPEGKLWEAKE